MLYTAGHECRCLQKVSSPPKNRQANPQVFLGMACGLGGKPNQAYIYI
jgi:hypothetical protein